MDPIVQKIMDNLEKVADKYEGMEKAHKINDYITQCLSKLKAKGKDELVVELKKAIHDSLEDKKRRLRQRQEQRDSYLRGPGESVHEGNDSFGGEGGDSSPSTSPSGGRLPFREDAF